MGEVYRAEDTNLSREVAIKVLPEQFTQDTQRLTRFELLIKEDKEMTQINVVLNWFEELKRLVPTN